MCARAGEEAAQFPAAEQREESRVGSEPAEMGRARFMDRESRHPFWAKGHCFWEQGARFMLKGTCLSFRIKISHTHTPVGCPPHPSAHIQ